jgi:hypothetical protein
MAAVLALLSTLVAAKLQLIQQWWLPTFDILDGCTCNGNNPTIKVVFDFCSKIKVLKLVF